MQLQSLPLPPKMELLLHPQPQPSLEKVLPQPPPQNNKRRIMIQQLLPPQLEKHPILEPSKSLFTSIYYVAGVVWFPVFQIFFTFTIFSQKPQKQFTEATKLFTNCNLHWKGANQRRTLKKSKGGSHRDRGK